jgi:glycosyltransferase involved in cell wall biosynthesis
MRAAESIASEALGPGKRAAEFRPCIVIPYFNHPGAIGRVLDALRPLSLPCYLVDDASNAASSAVLETISARERAWLTVLRHEVNQGKGGAVMTGCDAAFAAGFTHALQIDADGQHDSADAPRLLELARAHPLALITGTPQYDESVPRSRLYGRYVTHVWVWINTLSLQVRDSMCGLRVYPLAASTALWRRSRLGRRMDFDTEVIVRLVWRGVRVIGLPTRVTYPADGVSHFDVLRDNVAISKMHARLFFGMLWRAPWLIGRRVVRRFARRSSTAA